MEQKIDSYYIKKCKYQDYIIAINFDIIFVSIY